MSQQTEQRRSDSDERYVCTADAPWKPEYGRRSSHPDAKELYSEDGYPGGDIVTYLCPHCNLRFKEELPQ